MVFFAFRHSNASYGSLEHAERIMENVDKAHCVTDCARIFFINMDRSEARLAHMKRQAVIAGVWLNRIVGVIGSDVPGDLREQFLNADGSIASALSPGEVGCYASHLQAYRAVVERSLPFALVLEDDVDLPASLARIMGDIKAHLPADWDIVKLCNSAKRAVHTISVVSAEFDLVRFYRQPPLAGAYLISKGGAGKMLAVRTRVRPVDMEMRQPWHIGLDMYGVCPPPIRQRHDMESVINKLGARRKSGQANRDYGTFRYAVSKIGLSATLVCKLVEQTSFLGLNSIGKAWVKKLPRAPRDHGHSPQTIRGSGTSHGRNAHISESDRD